MELKHQRPADVVLVFDGDGHSFESTWFNELSDLKKRLRNAQSAVGEVLKDMSDVWDAVTTPGKVVTLSDGSRVRRKEDQ